MPEPGTRLIFVSLVCCLALFPDLVLSSPLCGGPLSLPLSFQAETEPLERILALAADYCQRLNGASLYYVCREDVQESHDTTVERLEWYGLAQRVSSKSRHWVYDYQLWRTSRGLSEVRTLTEEDGTKKNVPGARLEIEDFDFETVILGPNGMFGAKNQGSFDFALEKTDSLEGEGAAVIKATPKQGVEVHVLYGTAWLRLRDGAALRIDWDRESMRNVSAIEAETKKQREIAELAFRSVYAFEKNGLRFPSRYSIRLERKNPKAREFLQSPWERKRTLTEVEVVYSNYKFFTVEVEVKN